MKFTQTHKKFIIDFWESMIGIYLNGDFVRKYGDEPIVNGELTKTAVGWIECFKGLTRNEILKAQETLYIDYSTFSPTPIEYKNLVMNNGIESITDEILCKIHDGKQNTHEFKNKLAFNLWCKYSSVYLGAQSYELPKVIKRHIKMFENTELFDLPDYTKKAIEKPKQKFYTNEQKKEKLGFMSLVTDIYNDVNKKYHKELIAVCKKQQVFAIIEMFKKMDFIIPDLIEVPKIKNKEYYQKYDNRKLLLKSAISDFLSQKAWI